MSNKKIVKNVLLILSSCLLINFLLMYFSEVLNYRRTIHRIGTIDSLFLFAIATTLFYSTKSKKLLILFITIITISAYVQFKFFSVFLFGFRISYISILKEFFYVSENVSLSVIDFLYLIPIILCFFVDDKNMPKISIKYLLLYLLLYLCLAVSTPKHSQYFEVYNGVGFNIINSCIDTIAKKPIIEDESLINNYTKQEKNEFTGMFEGKNLIIVLSESLDDFVIEEWNMPNLYKLKNEGWYFSNFNVPVYPYHTIDTEFITDTGMIPSIDNGVTTYRFGSNSYPNALSNFFDNTEIDHNFISTYYNRIGMSRSLGYKKYLFADDIEDNIVNFYDILDTQLIENIDFSDKEQPFFNYIITLTMHGGYLKTIDELQPNLNFVEEYREEKDTELNNYYAKSIEYDNAMGILIKKLEENNLLEDTVIVILGDHKPFLLTEPPEDNVIPLIIYNPNIEAKVVEKECSIEDLYPTITNLFGFDTSKYYKAGVDIFSEEQSRMFNPIEINDDLLYNISQWVLINNFYSEER